MNNQKLAFSLRLFVLILGLFGLGFFFAIPIPVQFLIQTYPQAEGLRWIIQSMLFLGGILVYGALFVFWKICGRIGCNRSFCEENAKGLKQISWISWIETGLCLLGMILFLVDGILHPVLLLLGLGVLSFGCLMAVATTTLAYLVTIAEAIQTENELVV